MSANFPDKSCTLILICFSETILKKHDIVRNKSDCLSTKNAKGAQLATTTPVLQDWLKAYDGEHPLLDIGCAYGINTMEALKFGIPTVALDTHQTHLDVVREVADECAYKTLTCLLGSLPYDIPVPDESLSGILVSEVLHFLTGEEITLSLNCLFGKLKKGGTIALSTASIYSLCGIDDAFVEKFFEEKGKGVKWPGQYEDFDRTAAPKFAKAAKKRGYDFYDKAAITTFGNLCVLSQITDELEKAGFEIILAKEAEHPGYPAGVHLTPKGNIQVVARK